MGEVVGLSGKSEPIRSRNSVKLYPLYESTIVWIHRCAARLTSRTLSTEFSQAFARVRNCTANRNEFDSII